MITKGIITKIYEYSVDALLKPEKKYKAKVHLNVFDSPGFPVNDDLDCTIACEPGNSCSYKVDDVVFVGFENNSVNKPVILGKLYLGKETGVSTCVSADSLEATNKATLPLNTTIGEVTGAELYALTHNSMSSANNMATKTDIKPAFLGTCSISSSGAAIFDLSSLAASSTNGTNGIYMFTFENTFIFLPINNLVSGVQYSVAGAYKNELGNIDSSAVHFTLTNNVLTIVSGGEHYFAPNAVAQLFRIPCYMPILA